ncbi:MAG: hypothetical protein AAGA45_03905, partial [Verrucomicrobiota bacterium]
RAHCEPASAESLSRITSTSSPESSDTGRCVVRVRWPDGNGNVAEAQGRGASLQAALGGALSSLPGASPSWLRLEIVTGSSARTTRNIDPLRAGTWGVATDGQLSTWLDPLAINNRRLIARYGRFRTSRIARYERNADLAGTESSWNYLLSVESWLKLDGQWQRLHRGNRQTASLDTAVIEEAARGAADYLARAIGPNGRFVYDRRPWLGGSTSDYNILRHAGSTFSLYQAWQRFKDQRYLAAGDRAMDFLEQHIEPCPGQASLRCVVEDGEIKLGGNGLALVAISERIQATGDRKSLPLARQLAGWILAAQQDNGSYRPHKWSYPEGTADPFISAYYPGEAMLGLLMLYRLDPDKRWLDSAADLAEYLREGRDKSVSDLELPHDHWLLYGLAELYAWRPRAADLAHGERIARVILAAQNVQPAVQGDPEDWRGSFYRPPRSTPTATRAEALLGAWSLAEQSGKSEYFADYLTGLCHAMAFTLQTRFTPEKALFPGDAAAFAGGFHRSLTDYGVRNDYVQHNLSVLLGLLAIMETQQAWLKDRYVSQAHPICPEGIAAH